MHAMATPRAGWTLLTALTGLFLSLSVQAQQGERYTLSGDDVAIYNLAGELRLEPGPGSEVTIQVARGGADAAKMKVAQGKRDGVGTLRFVYPENRIQYGRMSDGSSTQLRVRDDGTFGDDHDGEDGARKRDGRQVTIAARGGGLDAHADLRIAVPREGRWR